MNDKSIRAEELVITDPQGTPRVRIGACEEGRYGFELLDREQRMVASLSAKGDGEVIGHFGSLDTRVVVWARHPGHLELQIRANAQDVARVEIDDMVRVDVNQPRVLLLIRDASGAVACAKALTQGGLVDVDFNVESC